MLNKKNLKIYTSDDAISVMKPNGTYVDYFLFPEYEIHYNQLSPRMIQEWHYHLQIEEVLIIISGKMICKWLDENGQVNTSIVSKNDVIQVGNSIHTFENITDEIAEFLVFRLVLDGKNKRALIKNDKTIVTTIPRNNSVE